MSGSKHMLPGTCRLRIADLNVAAPDKARTQSGIRRSAAQSPPPMTLPALADAMATGARFEFPVRKKERRQEAVTISVQALLAL